MDAVSEAFHQVPNRHGLVIAIIPGRQGDPQPRGGYPNRWVEIPVFTHLPLSGKRGTEPLSRNHINVLTSDVLVALPGGDGTSSEVALALNYGRPIVAYLADRTQIPDLPARAPVESDFEKVKEFVRSALDRVAA